MKQIVYSSSFLQFLQKSDCKIAKVLYKIHRKYMYRDNYNSLIVTDKDLNYITFRGDGTISFLPSGKEHKVNDSGEWARDGRQHGKPGKVIKKLLSEKIQKYFKDADFECFANSYKAQFNDDGYTFKLLSNKEIPKVYDMERAHGDGSLNNSCMNNDTSYLDLYKYCDKVQILTMTDKDNLLCGRSLVWKIDDNITLMDRIYTTQDFMFDKFLAYANEAKFWRKRDYKTYDNKKSFINPLGNEVQKDFTIFTNTDFDYFPYIDTFSYGEDGSLNNWANGCYSYSNTDGTRDGDNNEDEHEGEVYDDINEEYISEDDAVYIDAGERQYRSRYCHRENCVTVGNDYYYEDDCNIVEIDNEWYRKDDEDICEIDGEYYKKDDCVFSDIDDEYHLENDCVYSEEHSTYILKEDAVEVCGNYFLKDDVNELT